MDVVMCIVTTKDESEAEKIAEVLLKKRLAACCNIIPVIKSAYWWKGKLKKAEEAMIIIKTRKGLAENVIEAVRASHSYEVPTIDFIDVSNANRDCLKWVEAETSAEASESD